MKAHHDEPAPPPDFWSTRYAVGVLVIGSVAGYFLLTEHLAHVIQALPYLLLLACPLTHRFMHGKHGRHGHDRRGPGSTPARSDVKDPGERS